MGKQYNKVEKRNRRKNALKRKKNALNKEIKKKKKA